MTDAEEIVVSLASSRPPVLIGNCFKAFIILMPRGIRQKFVESWMYTDLEDLVVDMVAEVIDEEDEDDKTIEPSSSDDMKVDEEKTDEE